ncbi:MAG: hypothetical protein WD294_16720 [Phycisphaeraceae bacterium]
MNTAGKQVEKEQHVHRMRRREAGMAMVLVLIAVAVAFIMGLTFLAQAGTATATAVTMSDHAQARQIAEAGLGMAMYYVQNNSDWDSEHEAGTWLTDQTLAGGSFTLSAEDGDPTEPGLTHPITLVSVGRYGGGSHRVVRQIYKNSTFTLGIATSNKYSISGHTDGFDSADGPYGGENAGEEAVVGDTLALPPMLAMPDNVPLASEGDYQLDSGIHIINSSRHFGYLEVNDGAVLQIHGDVTVRVNDDFKMSDAGAIELIDDATLEIYVDGDVELWSGSKLNANTIESWRVVIYQRNNNNFIIGDEGTAAHAIIDAPVSKIEVQKGARAYGAIMARRFDLDSSSWFYHDRNPQLLTANPRLIPAN